MENNENMNNKKVEDTRIKYFVEKNPNKAVKACGLCGLVVVSGIIGGVISSYININKNESSNEPNKTVTTYNIEKTDNPVEAIAQKMEKSVVGIRVSYLSQNLWGLLSEAEGQGSGIIYSSEGYIITNYHVIESAVKNNSAKMYVLIADGETEYEANIIGYDEATDLAVIKIKSDNLVAAEFGNSKDLKVGSLAVAIGNPLGLEFAGTVTVGYISGLNRSIIVGSTEYNLIQTDAAINAGNSGGPLVDSTGKVIGINTVKVSATGVEGIGFAIPITEALPIVEELIQNKKIERPFIGIGGITLTESLAIRNNLVEGIYIQQITKNSPANIAGIRQGDVLTEANGVKVNSISELNAIKNKLKIGDIMNLKIYRSSEKGYLDIQITLAKTSDFE